MRAQRNSKKCRQYSVLLAAEIAQKQKIKTKTSMFNAMVRVYTCVPSSEESVSQNTVYWKMVLLHRFSVHVRQSDRIQNSELGTEVS